jgi:hypothetical protein
MTEENIPTTERLARALEEVSAPERMVKRAREGYYDDFKSPLAMPETQLMIDAHAAGLLSIVDAVKEGKFDATPEESAAWAESPEGQKIMKEFGFKNE